MFGDPPSDIGLILRTRLGDLTGSLHRVGPQRALEAMSRSEGLAAALPYSKMGRSTRRAYRKAFSGRSPPRSSAQVLKPLLEGIKDKQWRTKLGSVEVLARMTNCLPKQLAACLPQVVPALCGVINDQHSKVRDVGGRPEADLGRRESVYPRCWPTSLFHALP